MAESNENPLIVGLEVGNSKVVSIIAELQNEHLYVRGVGVFPSQGVSKGVVTNIEAIVDVIGKSIKHLEQSADCNIYSLTTSISGQHIEGDFSHGMVPIPRREVTLADKLDVIEKAGIIPISEDRMVLHILPQEYMIDNQGGIENPVGMSGVRLETSAYVISCAKNAVQNLNKCIGRCGVSVDQYIYHGLSSGVSVATQDEKKLGVCVVDIGSGTTDLTVYIDGAVVYIFSFPIAGDIVTNDIAYGERLTTDLAEYVKLNDGCCQPDPSLADKYIAVPTFSNQTKQISKFNLAKIMEARYTDIFELIKRKLKEERLLYRLGAGIILTGGGALAKDIIPLAEEVLDMQVRVGYPKNVHGFEEVLNDPKFSNIVGLMLVQNDSNFQKSAKDEPISKEGWFGGLLKTVKRYF